MPFNASGQSVEPLAVLKIYSPSALEGAGYNGLTTAQCAALSGVSSQAVTSSGALIEAAKVRTTGITLIVPTDQAQVTFGNADPRTATISANPIQAVPAINTFAQQVAASGAAPSSNGFALPPGASMLFSPFNDPMYAITASGVSATVYWFDS